MNEVLGRNADPAVAHGDAYLGVVCGLLQHLELDHHFAPVCEFDGVAAEIDQHLLQPHGVANQHIGQQRVHVEQHFDRLVAYIGRQDHRQVAQQAVHAKRLRIQRHLSGFDFGKIQHVVEQAK